MWAQPWEPGSPFLISLQDQDPPTQLGQGTPTPEHTPSSRRIAGTGLAALSASGAALAKLLAHTRHMHLWTLVGKAHNRVPR